MESYRKGVGSPIERRKGRGQQYCEMCRKGTLNRYLFKGQWVCMICYVKNDKIRDKRYYKKLLE